MAFLYEMVGGIMEILILLKANIIKKKGTFISIIMLTAIVSAVIATIFGVKDKYNNAIANSIKYSDSGDILTIVKPEILTDELCYKVENHKLVERVVYYDSICVNSIQCGEVTYGNDAFLMEIYEGIRLINENEDGYADEITELKSGEIYLPLGLKTNLDCDVGDTITVNLIKGVTWEFKIKGFVEEITMGSMNIGWKQIFVGREDYERILKTCKPLETEDIITEVSILMIHKAQGLDLTCADFQRKLNLDTGIFASAYGTMNIDQSVYYTKILPDTIMDIVLAFAVFLFIIVLIVMSHSIGIEVETDYTTLGILKSQGFTEGKIRLLFILQYMLSQIMGIIVGNIVSIPIERKISRLCQNATGVITHTGFAIGKCLIFTGAILIISIALICIKTIKISKISPVRAISGGHDEIFFDSRMNFPVTKKALSVSLSLRQFTSQKRRYMGTIFIAAILTFCMITVNLIGNMLSSRNALVAMGVPIYDFSVYYSNENSAVEWEEIDKLVEDYSQIETKNGSAYLYASLNGENLLCDICKFPEYISGIIKGRAPLYENEIMVTEFVADLLEVKIGDEVTVTFKTKENSFIISGIYQTSHDVGKSFLMNFDGAKRNGENMDDINRYYVLEDKSKLDEIVEKIADTYGDMLSIYVYDDESTGIAMYDEIVSLLKLIIYIFSVLFAFVVIRMVCTKSFIQERTSVGIYKAVGFTSSMLRFQFAIRFLITAVIGSAIGVILSILFSEKTLGMLLSQIGLSRIVTEYTAMTLIVPILAISISFFVFSFIVSRKIKRVEIKELITE